MAHPNRRIPTNRKIAAAIPAKTKSVSGIPELAPPKLGELPIKQASTPQISAIVSSRSSSASVNLSLDLMHGILAAGA